MSYEERQAKIKAEIQGFFDSLLAKILALPKLERDIKDTKTDKEFWGEMSDYEAEQHALEDFFSEDTKDILAIEEIWEAVKEAIREEADWITSDAKTFIKDGLDFNAEDTMNEKFDEIQAELEDALKRKHGITK